MSQLLQFKFQLFFNYLSSKVPGYGFRVFGYRGAEYQPEINYMIFKLS